MTYQCCEYLFIARLSLVKPIVDHIGFDYLIFVIESPPGHFVILSPLGTISGDGISPGIVQRPRDLHAAM